MTTLYNRVAALEVGPPGGVGRRIEGPRIRFDATKVLTATDTCQVTLWNPSPATLDALQTPGIVTRVLAGYGTAQQVAYGQVVRGSLRIDRTVPNPSVTWRVTDGGLELRASFLSRAWFGGVDPATVVRALAADIGLAVGPLTFPAGFIYSDGFIALNGARQVFDEVAADTSCAWSVIDGVLSYWPRNGTRSQTGYLFSASSGMVGSPVPGDKRTLQVTSLLQPAMRPGDRFRVQSRDFNGDYVATTVVHRGEAAATGPVSDEFVTVAIGRPL